MHSPSYRYSSIVRSIVIKSSAVHVVGDTFVPLSKGPSRSLELISNKERAIRSEHDPNRIHAM